MHIQNDRGILGNQYFFCHSFPFVQFLLRRQPLHPLSAAKEFGSIKMKEKPGSKLDQIDPREL
jgi:hypothetical protein